MRASSIATRGLAIAIALLLGGSLGAQTAPEELRQHPGYVDVSALGIFSTDDLEMHVSVKGPMLDLVAAATRESEPDLATMLEGLKAVEVLIFDSSAKERQGLEKSIHSAASRLETKGWVVAVTLRTRNDYGYVLFQLRAGKPLGLIAMYAGKDGDSFLVNIVGEIDPAQIGRLAQRFNIDFLAEGALLPPSENPPQPE